MDTDLIAGPYRAPAAQVGDWLDDEIDGATEVGGWTAAMIPWPRRKKTGRPSLILTAELARAVRTESVAAIRHWWGVGPTKVWQWRQALGVDTTAGSQRIARRGVPLEAAARGRERVRDADVRERIAESKRGKKMSASAKRAISVAATRQRTKMTPEDMEQWRYRLGLSRKDAAVALGMSLRGIYAYESGDRPIPGCIGLACSMLYVNPSRALPTSMVASRKAMGMSQEKMTAALGYDGGTMTVWQFEEREKRGIRPKRFILLALAAVEDKVMPWQRLRRGRKLKMVDPTPGQYSPHACSPIASWRARMCLSQRAAAEALGMSLSAYQEQERGQQFSGKPRRASKVLLLACAALEHGIAPIE